MKRKLLRLLTVAAVLLTASCTDDKYDLSEIDTTSQFAVKDLVVPLNMAPVKLDNIISIEDDGDIKTDKDGKYYFEKKCKEPFKSDPVDVKKITINKPEPVIQTVSVKISLDKSIRDAIIAHNAQNEPFQTILDDPTLSSEIGLYANTQIYSVNIESKKNLQLNATGIDEKITKLDELGFEQVTMNINVTLGKLMELVKIVKIDDLKIDLPCGMNIKGIDDNISPDNVNKNKYSYDSETGVLGIVKEEGNPDGNLRIVTGNHNIGVNITGLGYETMKGTGPELFDKNNHEFNYEKVCGISGNTSIVASDLNPLVTLNKIDEFGNMEYECNVGFSDNIVVNKFSGGIYHEVEGINIDPVDITNLPEILQEEGTSIEVANPQLYLRVTNPDFNKENPAFSNNFKIQAGLRIKGNEFMPKAEEGIVVALDGKTNNKVLSPEKDGLRYPTSIYDWIEFTDMRGLLSGSKIPEKLNIDIVNPVLKDDKVTDFELGKTYQGITGEWEFYAKLALTGNTRIKYTNEWDDWGSEDLDGLTVENATVFFKMTKDVALDADVTFTLNGEAMENGKMVEKKLKGETSLNMNEQEVKIPMTGGPIKNIKGGNLVVILKGKGIEINTKQTVEVSNLRMTVNGYYDKEF